MNGEYLQMDWQNGFEATLDARVILTDEYIPMTPVPESNFGRLVLEDTSKENFEIIRYNRKDTGGVYVETIDGGIRNEDGTSSGIHPRGARVRGNITAQDLREFRQAAKDVQDDYAALVAGSDWRSTPVTPTVVSNDGSHQHKIRFAAVDLTGTLPLGAKIKSLRTGTVPTKSPLFNGTSQYASKAAPAGMTTTAALTARAIVEINGYTGQPQVIAGRFNEATSGGWMFRISSWGNVELYFGTNGSNFRSYATRQAVVPGVQTEVAVVLSAVGTAPKFYIDGAEVASYLPTSAGTAGYSQGGDFAIGARYGGASWIQFFNGYISEVAYYSAALTEAQVRDRAGQQLVGNETNLVGYWKLDNDFNDSTANNNHLTPGGGVVATNVKHPFSAAEFAIATKVEFVGGNTDVTLFTGENILPNVLGATSYSTARTPIGFPAARTRWRTRLRVTTDLITGTLALGINDYMGGLHLEVPIGLWRIPYSGVFTQSNGAAANVSFRVGFTTTQNSETGRVGALTRAVEIPNGISTTTFRQVMSAETEFEATTYSQLWMWTVYHVGNTVTIRINAENDRATFEMFAECAYL